MNDPDSYALAVVIVTHDSAPWLAEFFRSWHIAAASAPTLRARGVRMVVADSGSLDQTVAIVRELAPATTVIACGNVGYGAAANRGIRAAAGRGGNGAGAPQWVLLCNPDLTFAADFPAQLIEPLLSCAGEDSACPWRSAACIAPALLNEDQSPQPSVGYFPTLRALVRDQFRARQFRKYLVSQPAAATRADWASGACLLLNRAAFESVGGFDERYFLYVEELDLQRRLMERGYQTWFVPEAKVVHHAPNAGRAPRAHVQRWAARGMLRYFAKFGSGPQLLGYRILCVAGRRLDLREACAARDRILAKATGP